MGDEAYLAIDTGASKTLFAVFGKDGEPLCECKIKTSPDYPQFKKDLESEIKSLQSRFSFSYICCAAPGMIDFEKGAVKAFGNETWRDVPFVDDIKEVAPAAKVLLHNDAKLAALSEALLLGDKYKRVLYLTISTGIGGGVINEGKIDPDFVNFEPGQMVFEHDGQVRQWEDLASGRALKARYGKMASEIDDAATWREYSKSLYAGFENVLATVQPDVVIIGGGVGAHFEMFKQYLEEDLNNINNPLVPTPPLLKAQRPEEAVIYGCYEYIKQNL